MTETDFFWNAIPHKDLLLDTVKKAALLHVPILIVGETGCGKELVSHQLHKERREHYGFNAAEAPFIPVNVSTIPESLAESDLFGHERGAFTSARDRKPGKFERAQKGTLLLDEIQTMPLSIQAKLIRVLQDRSFERLGGRSPVNVQCQVICASNQPLELLVEEKKFRLDLYYRLNAFPIYLMPLRSMKGHIFEAALRMNEKITKQHKLAPKELHPETRSVLEKYDWPGNFRELEFALIAANLRSTGDKIYVKNLPQQIRGEFQAYIDDGYWRRNASY